MKYWTENLNFIALDVVRFYLNATDQNRCVTDDMESWSDCSDGPLLLALTWKLAGQRVMLNGVPEDGANLSPQQKAYYSSVN